jgi:hypothetical protein
MLTHEAYHGNENTQGYHVLDGIFEFGIEIFHCLIHRFLLNLSVCELGLVVVCGVDSYRKMKKD